MTKNVSGLRHSASVADLPRPARPMDVAPNQQQLPQRTRTLAQSFNESLEDLRRRHQMEAAEFARSNPAFDPHTGFDYVPLDPFPETRVPQYPRRYMTSDSRRRYHPQGRFSMPPQHEYDFHDASPDHYFPPPVPPKISMPQPEVAKPASKFNPADYTEPFLRYMTDNPTIFHAVDQAVKDLEDAGFSKLSERKEWKLERGGKYFVERNGSSLVAFAIGDDYEPGNGAAILAGHIDALTAKLKPIPTLKTKAGFVQLGVAPYAGALNSTWWDRDLGIGGRVLVRESSGKIVTKLVLLDWPIARIPTLAPHFGVSGPFNKETQMVPIVGLDNSDLSNASAGSAPTPPILGGEGTFASTQPERLVRAIAKELGITDYSSIVNWELELFDSQPATLGGLDKEFIFAGRIDDKLCSWAAYQALINSTKSTSGSGIIKIVGLFDDEEIGSLLRQGARGNFLPATMSRIVSSFTDKDTSEIVARTNANSFLVSSDVIHAVNPNFLNVYLENHAPRLNVGLAVSADSNGHMTTDAVSTAILKRCADKCGATLQVFQIRNDTRSGGTVGPMLSAKTGIRAIDAGIPQLSMHSIRATTGALDPGLGVQIFQGFLDHFESVDKEFSD